MAEKLYTQGFISYPRTETNSFSKDINLMSLVEMQTDDNRWGGTILISYNVNKIKYFVSHVYLLTLICIVLVLHLL